jgi:major membrane immunogen (membrane-anchored lipoprotein)
MKTYNITVILVILLLVCGCLESHTDQTHVKGMVFGMYEGGINSPRYYVEVTTASGNFTLQVSYDVYSKYNPGETFDEWVDNDKIEPHE